MITETAPSVPADGETLAQLQADIDARRAAVREAALEIAQSAFDGNLPDGWFTIVIPGRQMREEHLLFGPVHRMVGLAFGPNSRPQYSQGAGPGEAVPAEARFTGITGCLVATEGTHRPFAAEVTLGMHVVDLHEVVGLPVAPAYLDNFAVTRRDEDGRAAEVPYTETERLQLGLAHVQAILDMVVPQS